MTLRRLIRKAFSRLSPSKSDPYNLIYERFKGHTMVPRDIFYANLNLAKTVQSLQGCVVECGVWKGGMIAAIATVLGPNRSYYLFDSFAGLPPAQEIDGIGAQAWQNDRESENYYDNCRATKEDANEAMNLAEANHFELVEGWFSESLPRYNQGEKISLLRLDGDWYDSTMSCLDNLFDRVASGGIIIIDDYYTWDGCSRAVHDFLSKRSALERIDCFANVCFIIKK